METAKSLTRDEYKRLSYVDKSNYVYDLHDDLYILVASKTVDMSITIKTDPVNHPVGYTSHPSGIECIDVTRHMNFNVGNAIKYLWRCGIKPDADAIQDLRKAVWYIEDQIKTLEDAKKKEPDLFSPAPSLPSQERIGEDDED